MAVANALAYCETVTITAVRRFMVLAPGRLTIELFTAVINTVS
jgi:hypothetical protein